MQAELRRRWYDTSGIFSPADRTVLRDLLLRYLESVLWSPSRDAAAKFNPLHAYHEKHARRSALAFQKWKIKTKARKEGRFMSPYDIQRALDDV